MLQFHPDLKLLRIAIRSFRLFYPYRQNKKDIETANKNEISFLVNEFILLKYLFIKIFTKKREIKNTINKNAIKA
jgi:hypothetical protein